MEYYKLLKINCSYYYKFKLIRICTCQLLSKLKLLIMHCSMIYKNQQISRALKCQQHYSLNMCVVGTLINTGEVTMRLMANRIAFL